MQYLNEYLTNSTETRKQERRKMKNIVIKGAREHNLKNITVKLPRDRFIVITGVSGSGKSTLAFDTIYAEGQRRYVESLSLCTSVSWPHEQAGCGQY